MSLNLPWDQLNAIKYRLNFPETVPEGAHYTTYRQDIEYMLGVLETVDQNPDSFFEAQWCWDSETGDRCLIDRRTNKVITRVTWNVEK